MFQIFRNMKVIFFDNITLIDYLTGQRMCICHLPCRNLKPSLSGDQVSKEKPSSASSQKLFATCDASFESFLHFKIL